MANLVWWLVWIILPFILGFAIWGVFGGIGLAILGVILYITQRSIAVERYWKKHGLNSKSPHKIDPFADMTGDDSK